MPEAIPAIQPAWRAFRGRGAMPDVVPRKLFYKLNEVCQLTDTQPYVLRFWESEFAHLAPTRSRTGQRLYRKKDIEMVREIKKLLYDEGYTIAGARAKLGMGEDPGTLESILDPDAQDHLSSGRPDRAVTAELEEILRLMDGNDRRLESLRDPAEPRRR